MHTFAAVARVLFQGSPDNLLGSLLERAPDLKQDLFKFVSQWEHGDHVAIFNGVAAPLNTGKWPTEPDDELIWYLSEEMSGHWTTAAAGCLEVYLACLLLRYEALKGEAAIPQAPLCTAVVVRHMLSCDDGLHAAMLCRFMLHIYTQRKSPFGDGASPCPELAILMLLQAACGSLSADIVSGLENGALPWLWDRRESRGSGREDKSLVAWRSVMAEHRQSDPATDVVQALQEALSK